MNISFGFVSDFFGFGNRKSLLIALLIFLSLFYRISDGLGSPLLMGNTDTNYYHETAVAFYNNWKFTVQPDYPPGYPVLLGLLYHLSGPYFYFSKIFNPVFATMLAICVFYISKKIFQDNKVALISMIFILLDPEVSFYSSSNYKESSFLFLIFLSLAIHLHLRERSFGDVLKRSYLLVIIQCLAIVFSAYANPWTLAFIPLFSFDYWLFGRTEDKTKLLGFSLDRKVPESAGYLCLLLFMTVLLMVPWMLMLYSSFDRFIALPSNSGYLMYFSNNPSQYSDIGFTSNYPDETFQPLRDWVAKENLDYNLSDKVGLSKAAMGYSINYILTNPWNTITHAFKSLGYLLLPNLEFSQRTILNPGSLILYMTLLLVCFSIGVYFFFRGSKGTIKAGIILLLFMGLIIAIHLFPPYLMRYKLYFMPVEAIFAAFFLSRIKIFDSAAGLLSGNIGIVMIVTASVLIAFLMISSWELLSIQKTYSQDSFYIDLKQKAISEGDEILKGPNSELLQAHFADRQDLLVNPADLYSFPKRDIYLLSSSVPKELLANISESLPMEKISSRLLGDYKSFSIYSDTASFEEWMRSNIVSASESGLTSESISFVQQKGQNLGDGNLVVTYTIYVNHQPTSYQVSVILDGSGRVLFGMYQEDLYLIKIV